MKSLLILTCMLLVKHSLAQETASNVSPNPGMSVADQYNLPNRGLFSWNAIFFNKKDNAHLSVKYISTQKIMLDAINKFSNKGYNIISLTAIEDFGAYDFNKYHIRTTYTASGQVGSDHSQAEFGYFTDELFSTIDNAFADLQRRIDEDGSLLNKSYVITKLDILLERKELKEDQSGADKSSPPSDNTPLDEGK